MTDLTGWIQHRMSLLEISGPVALAEQADLAEETVVRVFESNQFDSLQQSQLRRLAWALQVNLRKLNALADGRVHWIDDADRYLPFSLDPALGDDAVDPRASVGLSHTGATGAPEPPQGTPVLGRVCPDGRVESDECWDEQWGRRLPDGQPQRRDTYALEAGGRSLVVRNANPWEARAGAMVAVYLFDDADGAAWFGQLTRCNPGNWSLRPGPPGHASNASNASSLVIEPERVQRIGRLLRQWAPVAGDET
jgi:hypothetical protein